MRNIPLHPGLEGFEAWSPRLIVVDSPSIALRSHRSAVPLPPPHVVRIEPEKKHLQWRYGEEWEQRPKGVVGARGQIET